jgi:hypothetical protein
MILEIEIEWILRKSFVSVFTPLPPFLNAFWHPNPDFAISQITAAAAETHGSEIYLFCAALKMIVDRLALPPRPKSSTFSVVSDPRVPPHSVTPVPRLPASVSTNKCRCSCSFRYFVRFIRMHGGSTNPICDRPRGVVW